MYLSVRFLLLPQDFFFYCVIREPSRVHRPRHRRAFFCQWQKCANPIPCDEFQTVSCSTCLFDLHRSLQILIPDPPPIAHLSVKSGAAVI
jgi:hypothetical protein